MTLYQFTRVIEEKNYKLPLHWFDLVHEGTVSC